MPNRLAAETSPYLRQHADNPVDWWPWSDAALAAARAQNKPILLSIGYAACHWCHVMAHESFEDDEIARVMNALYINIKVDREERPDVDKVYQLAHQALARRGGGWPLTVFLTPDDLLPFFAGTYFPKTPRYGMAGFTQVLEGVRRWFDQKPDEVRAQNASLAAFLTEHGRADAHADALDDAPIRAALARIEATFDAVHGGHTGAPKFPHASEIELLLATDAAGGKKFTEMANLTLARMADGGLRDHVGGGFFRYCVDERWEIPHFEKMLYDNAQLLPLYARAAADNGNPEFAEAAQDCARWLVSEMSAPEGGFWSSLDADSEGEEGRFYVWDREEIRGLLDTEEFVVAERRFGLDRPPNFESHAWHLRVVESFDETAAALRVPVATVRSTWLRARERLAASRAVRVRPGLDDKILTAWNALLIAGVARAGGSDGFKALLDHAEQALDFLHANLWKDGKLYASHARGTTKFPAYLDDHAFLLDALLAMLQTRWSARDLDWAIALADALLECFEDREGGGFYFTAHDAEPLPQRPKPFFDESLPAGNGVAARALLRLGHLLGETRYIDAAERTLRAAWPMLVEMPNACCTLLIALDEFLRPRTHVVIRYGEDETARAWRAAIAASGSRRLDAYFVPSSAQGRGVLGAQMAGRNIVAYVCEGTTCGPPIGTLEELQAALQAQR